MTSWQKYIIHPITAVLFALGSARFIHHFSLLEFSYASQLSFVVILISYLLLSKKYDTSLSIIFLSISLFLSYKSLNLKDKVALPTEPKTEATRILTIAASLVKQYEIQNKTLPQSLGELDYTFFSNQKNNLRYTHEPTGHFLIYTNTSSKSDKTNQTWYINDSFEVFEQKNDSTFESVVPK